MIRIHPTTEAEIDENVNSKTKDLKFPEVVFIPPFVDDNDEEELKKLYEPSTFEKIINYLLCR